MKDDERAELVRSIQSVKSHLWFNSLLLLTLIGGLLSGVIAIWIGLGVIAVLAFNQLLEVVAASSSSESDASHSVPGEKVPGQKEPGSPDSTS